MSVYMQALLAEQESGTSTKGQTLTEQILQIMETILLEASSQPHDVHKVSFVELHFIIKVNAFGALPISLVSATHFTLQIIV